MSYATADLYDDFEDKLQIMTPSLKNYGGQRQFFGRVSTLKTFEDNTYVRKALEEPGNGQVLVVDGEASLRCALLGDMLANIGLKNGWAGIVINGCVRDVKLLSQMDFGVKALNSNPRKSVKNNIGERNVKLQFLDVEINPGDYLYSDDDGIVISSTPLK